MSVANDMAKALLTYKTITNTKNEVESLLAPNVSAKLSWMFDIIKSYKIICNITKQLMLHEGFKSGPISRWFIMGLFTLHHITSLYDHKAMHIFIILYSIVNAFCIYIILYCIVSAKHCVFLQFIIQEFYWVAKDGLIWL